MGGIILMIENRILIRADLAMNLLSITDQRIEGNADTHQRTFVKLIVTTQ